MKYILYPDIYNIKGLYILLQHTQEHNNRLF